MVIAIFGESCVGKSTIAEKLAKRINAEIYSGKDYMRLAKNEQIAKKLFQEKLIYALTGDHVIYVISEKEHLRLLPDGAIKVLATAKLDKIKERFAERMHGNLPKPVEIMLEKKHGMFDNEVCDLKVNNEEYDISTVCDEIEKLI
ncbi:MAG: hypothetical protein ACI4II_05505 [Acutalibacteraceae bacterium]